MALEEETRSRAWEPWVKRFNWSRIAACRRRVRGTSQRSLGGVSTRFGGRSVVTLANVESMVVSLKPGARPVEVKARLYSLPPPNPRGRLGTYLLWWERGWSFELRKRFWASPTMAGCDQLPHGAVWGTGKGLAPAKGLEKSAFNESRCVAVAEEVLDQAVEEKRAALGGEEPVPWW